MQENPYLPPQAPDRQDPVGRLGDFDAYEKERKRRLVGGAAAGLFVLAFCLVAGVTCQLGSGGRAGLAGPLLGAAVGLLIAAWHFASVWRRTIRLGDKGIVVAGDWIPWSDVFYLATKVYVEDSGSAAEKTHDVVYIGFVKNKECRIMMLHQHSSSAFPTWMYAAAARVRTELTEEERAVVSDFESSDDATDDPP